MNHEMNDEQSGLDDHEPGDVNGNVDPAWAKQQKLKAKQQAAGERQPRAPREPRGPRTARVPREARAPSATGEPPASEGGVVAAASVAPSDINVTIQPSSDAAVNAETASDLRAQGDAPREQRHSGERRARGMRRPRNARAQGERHETSNAAQRPDELGVGRANEETQYSEVMLGSPYAEGQSIEVPMLDGAESGSTVNNPNPGAFGDPRRPMDNSARRNRNRTRNREKSDRGRAIREARIQAEAGEAAALEGVVGETGEGVATERDGERLHKVLAQQGLGSRRAMESLIESGEVEVNGKPAQVGQVVNERDRVYVKRRKVTIKLGDEKPRIMIYHKPAGEIVTRDDPEARDTVFDRLPKPDHGKWIAIGRLDYNTEGLLLFTTSGELANRMMHPRYEIMREYSVRVLGELTPEQEDELIDGIELDDGPARVLSLDRIDRDSEGANHWYRITINEGRNREVRRMFEHLGLTVSRLIRTRYGAVNMPSWLKRGQYKLLDENDTFNILEAVGMRSRKKLEKAARFGGARGKLPQQGPVGPMRSATEHEAVWNGAPAAGGGAGLPGDRRGRRNPRGGLGSPRGDSFGSSLSLQQQQFPGFGGGAADAAPGNRRGPNRGGRGNARRPGGGEVNGNVDPNFRAGRGGRNGPAGRNGPRGRGPRANAMPDFDENGNLIVPAAPPPRLGPDGQPMAANPNNERGNRRNPRGRNNRGGRGRENGGGRDATRGDVARGVANDSGAVNAEAAFGANVEVGAAIPAGGDAQRPRGRNRRGARRGGNRGGGRRDERGGSDAPAPVVSTPPTESN